MKICAYEHIKGIMNMVKNVRSYYKDIILYYVWLYCIKKCFEVRCEECIHLLITDDNNPVSYTHLDVYKRQYINSVMHLVLRIHMGVCTKHFYIFERYIPDYLIFFLNNSVHSEISKPLCYTSLYLSLIHI